MIYKILLISTLLIFSLHVHAQTEQPSVKDLSRFAPLNPQQGNTYLPVQLSNKNVESILVMNSKGLATNQTIYNKDGWPVSMSNSSQLFTYNYLPGKQQLVSVAGSHNYDLDANGNVTHYWEADQYGNVEFKTENIYDANENIILSKRYQRQQVGKGQYEMGVVSEVAYKYDAKNRKISEIGGAYEYNYEYNVSGSELIVSIYKSGEKISEYTYDENGILTQYTSFSYGTTTTQYNKTYSTQGLLLEEIITSTNANDNKTNGYLITYRDGTMESPDNNNLQFVDENKKNDLYTKAVSNFSTNEGFFENGILNGPGFMSKNGIQHKGNFKDGKLSGYGQMNLPLIEQANTFGFFDNGMLNGYGFIIKGSDVVEAGIFAKGVLKQNLGEDYLAKKSSAGCKGNCIDGFGEKSENGIVTYTFFEKGNPVGPYIIIKDGRIAQYGGRTEDAHFIDGVVDEIYYYGMWTNKKSKAKIVRNTNLGLEAGIINDGEFSKVYELIIE